MANPIETAYKGYRFRSRLEARWAVFFDTLTIPWQYEKEGFKLGKAGWYLPDFWLPTLHCWVEIKGDTPPSEDIEKIKAFAWQEGTAPILLLQGVPALKGGDFYCLDSTDNGGGTCVMDKVQFGYCHNCKTWALDFGDWDSRYERGDRILLNPDWSPWQNPCQCTPPTSQNITFGELFEAITAARSARFEHGELPL